MSELTYERAKQLYTPYDEGQMRHLCALRDVEIDRLRDENAKLRELVRILYYCGLPWKDCDKCAMNGAEMHVKISEIEFCDGMYDRMRELGIEVDE